MPPLDVLIAFLATTAIFAYIPGPAMLYAAAQTMARGRSSGFMAALGIHIGGYAHVIAAAAGLTILFHAVPALYLIVKIAGAAYLVWLGIAMIRGAARAADTSAIHAGKTGWRAFAESVTVEVLNPKTAIFFLSFLPQFIDPSAAFPVWIQFVILGTIVNMIFTSADLVCVFLAAAMTRRMQKSSRFQRLLRRAGGTVLVGLGVNLALQKH